MTSPHVEQASHLEKAKPAAMPSRQFLVQQAVLNAANAAWPWVPPGYGGLGPYLSGYTRGGTYVNGFFQSLINQEFGYLVSLYEDGEGPADPDLVADVRERLAAYEARTA